MSGLNVEQRARRDVPRLLAEWTRGDARVVAADELVPTLGKHRRADFILRVDDVLFVVEVKARAGVSTVTQAAAHARACAEALRDRNEVGASVVLPLVVVPYMSNAGKARLEEGDISWVDLSGNASIHVSGSFRLHVWVDGKPNQFRRRGRPKNLFAPKACRLVRYLLLHPGRSFRQRALAEETGLGEGYVSRLVRSLEEQDLLVRRDDGTLCPRDYDLLLDAWAEGNAYRHKPLQGHLPARSGEDRMRRVAQAFEDEDRTYAATGLAAAWAYTHAASFRTATVYILQVPPEGVLDRLGFRQDSKAANLTLLLPDDEGVFMESRPVEGIRCVAPVQAYVDLRHESERADEMANVLRASHLDWEANEA